MNRLIAQHLHGIERLSADEVPGYVAQTAKQSAVVRLSTDSRLNRQQTSNGGSGMSQLEPWDALNLPASDYIQTANFLASMETGLCLADLGRVADRAEGFVFGIETLRSMDYSALEGLYLLLNDTVQAHSEALKE